jgi:hypothetical protein
MIVFLKNTVTQINVETQKGNAPVVRAQQPPAPTETQQCPRYTPKGVDAVTGGTQGISHYFAAQGQIKPQPPKPDTEDT